LARRQIDSVFSRRAIFIDARALQDAGQEVLGNLRWLGRFYLIIAVGRAVEKRQELAGIVHESLKMPDVPPCIHAHSIEAYASWFIGDGPALGFRKVMPCLGPGAAARALRAIRRVETTSPIIIDYELLGDRIAAMRRRGERIVFTNGVFDLLHIGHLRLLENARRLGDRLIVGINSDESTKKIKGTARPIVPQFARAEILTRLRQVDCCCIFTETDPKKVLAIVRPDVLAKGSEYTLARVIGARFVMGYGGRVARLPLVDGFSTTSTIRGIGLKAGSRRR
jgi:D-beta-D-heptose 7-phosphate kinase/D-beta-D-heptose 1-phosphate adenosyltransferase